MIGEPDVDTLPWLWAALSANVALRTGGGSAFNPYTNGLPIESQQRLAGRYAEWFGILPKHQDVLTRVPFWGVTDGDSWLNSWPIERRTSYPLPFDREGKPKPALHAVLALGRRGRASRAGSRANDVTKQVVNLNSRTISK